MLRYQEADSTPIFPHLTVVQFFGRCTVTPSQAMLAVPPTVTQVVSRVQLDLDPVIVNVMVIEDEVEMVSP